MQRISSSLRPRLVSERERRPRRLPPARESPAYNLSRKLVTVLSLTRRLHWGFRVGQPRWRPALVVQHLHDGVNRQSPPANSVSVAPHIPPAHRDSPSEAAGADRERDYVRAGPGKGDGTCACESLVWSPSLRLPGPTEGPGQWQCRTCLRASRDSRALIKV